MYEIQWLGPPQTDAPPEVLGRESFNSPSLEAVIAYAKSAFVEHCRIGRRPYGFRIRDHARRSVWIWGQHDGACATCPGYGISASGPACPLAWGADAPSR